MKEFINYLDPNVPMPEELEQLALSVIETTPDLQAQYVGKSSHMFQCYQLPEPVIDWIKENIKLPDDLVPFDFKIHVVHHDLRLHSDYGRTWALNYVIDTGGPSSESVWYTDDRQTKLYGEIIPSRTWHYFNTEYQHTVHGIDPAKLRTGITITVQKRSMDTEISLY